MPAPTTVTYQTQLGRLLKEHEGIRQNIYLDTRGLPTIGLGLLLLNSKKELQTQAILGVRGVLGEDRQRLLDQIVETLRSAGTDRAALERNFVIEKINGVPTLTRFRQPGMPDNSAQWADIRTLLPSEASALTAAAEVVRAKERATDNFIQSARIGTVTESQRAALMSRIYNGFTDDGQSALINAMQNHDPVAMVTALTSSRSTMGHVRRVFDEFELLLGPDKITRTRLPDGTVNLQFLDRNGIAVTIGYDVDARGIARRMFAYREQPDPDGSTQRVYFDPRANDRFARQIPLRETDKTKLAQGDPVLLATQIDALVDDLVAAAGLAGRDAEHASDTVQRQVLAFDRSQVLPGSEALLASDGLHLVADSLELNLDARGAGSEIREQHGRIVKTVFGNTPAGSLTLHYSGPDLDHLALTDVRLGMTSYAGSPDLAYDAGGNLILRQQSGNRITGTVLTGTLAGQRFTLLDRNGAVLMPAAPSLVDTTVPPPPGTLIPTRLAVDLTQAAAPGRSGDFVLTLDDLRGALTTRDVQPITAMVNGLPRVTGTRTENVEMGRGVVQARSITRDEFSPTSGERLVSVDRTQFGADGSFASRTITSRTTAASGTTLRDALTHLDAGGRPLQAVNTQYLSPEIRRILTLDAQQQTLSDAHQRTFADGSTWTETRWRDGRTEAVMRDADGLTFTPWTTGSGGFVLDDSGSPLRAGAGPATQDDSLDGYLILPTPFDPRPPAAPQPADNTPYFSPEVIAGILAPSASAVPPAAPAFDALAAAQTVTSLASLVGAVRAGQPLPILAAGSRTLLLLQEAFTGRQDPILAAASQGLGALGSLQAMRTLLRQGDTLGAAVAGTGALQQGLTAWRGVLLQRYGSEAAAIQAGHGTTLQWATDLGRALPWLSLANNLAQRNPAGLLLDVMTLTPALAPLVPFLVAMRALPGLFDDGDPGLPWGNGRFDATALNPVTAQNALTFTLNGAHGGEVTVRGLMQGFAEQLAGTLQALRVGPQATSSYIGTVAQRLPDLAHDPDGFTLNFYSASGAARSVRYDLTGRPVNAPADSPEAGRDLTTQFLHAALEAEAIAPHWQVDTAWQQGGFHVPQAGLNEVQRAAANGLLAPPRPADAPVQWKPVVIDFDRNGSPVVNSATALAMFDPDGSGYLRRTDWVSGGDAFLVLDRDGDGRINQGADLLAHPDVATAGQGLASLAWLDGNGDGRISTIEPAGKALRIWRDRNGNGLCESGELSTLADDGAYAVLDYRSGLLTTRQGSFAVSSPTLRAEATGLRVASVAEGLLVIDNQERVTLVVGNDSAASAPLAPAAVTDAMLSAFLAQAAQAGTALTAPTLQGAMALPLAGTGSLPVSGTAGLSATDSTLAASLPTLGGSLDGSSLRLAA